MKVQTRAIRRLIILLQKACHAPDCDTTFKCPRQCGCRSRRTFKLNTETAICYQLAEDLNSLVRYSSHNKALKTDIIVVVEAATAYTQLSRYHMTLGWMRFFKDVTQCIVDMTKQESFIWPRSVEKTINDLEYRINRLKRYPK